MTAQEQIYIDNMNAQIEGGMYDHLFNNNHDLVFLDIGANIGLVSIYAVPYCRRILAIEPSPETFQRLKEFTSSHPIIECYETALAPQNGVTDFFVNDINFTASSTVNTYGSRIMVQAKTLSTLLDYHRLTHVDVCKIDAEGAEGESLIYGELDKAKPIIKTYYIETHNCPRSTWEYKMGVLVEDFARLGYHKMKIDGMALTATHP